MKNKLTDLNDHLFSQLERLSGEDLDADGLRREIDRAGAIVGIAREIIANAKLVLDAQKAVDGGLTFKAPAMLGVSADAAEPAGNALVPARRGNGART